jgi:nitrogen fixation protein NifU and related proteins
MMDDALAGLQEEIDARMRRTYTETVIDHAMNPRNVGMLSAADAWARLTGPCGDTMEVWIKVRENIVDRASFWTDGCGASIACGSMVTELARGRTIEECLEIGEQGVLDALGDLPEESRHCALLAATTLKAAAGDYMKDHYKPSEAGQS